MNYFKNITESNMKYVSDRFSNSIVIIDKAMKLEMKLYESISFTLFANFQATNEFTSILLSGFYKSLLSINGAYDLNVRG